MKRQNKKPRLCNWGRNFWLLFASRKYQDKKSCKYYWRESYKKGQAERVVLNLDDWKGDVDALIKQLNDYPIEGLKEVIIVYDGSVQSIYP